MNRPPNENPTAAEFGQLRAFLATKGVSQAQIDEVVPAGAHATMTRGEIVEKMKELCRSFPKAQ